jgi:hypothetical protein
MQDFSVFQDLKKKLFNVLSWYQCPFTVKSHFSCSQDFLQIYKEAVPTYAGELSDHPRINHQKVKQQTASTAQFLTCIYKQEDILTCQFSTKEQFSFQKVKGSLTRDFRLQTFS